MAGCVRLSPQGISHWGYSSRLDGDLGCLPSEIAAERDDWKERHAQEQRASAEARRIAETAQRLAEAAQTEAALRWLRKDAPDLHASVIAGELTSHDIAHKAHPSALAQTPWGH